MDIFQEFERDVLRYDPFAGDFGGQDDKVFRDGMIRAAKDHEGCHICGGTIRNGERHRHRVEKFDGDLATFRWCWACCTAMARVWTGYDQPNEELPHEEIYRRQDLHRAPHA
jgi:hypothetical protein